jgi:hypothetical protein
MVDEFLSVNELDFTAYHLTKLLRGCSVRPFLGQGGIQYTPLFSAARRLICMSLLLGRSLALDPSSLSRFGELAVVTLLEEYLPSVEHRRMDSMLVTQIG